jgi:hypothetical protein
MSSVPSSADTSHTLTKDEERVYEAHIVIQLGAGRAIYCERLGRLYFFDAADKQIGAAVEAALRGLGHEADIRPVELDQHRCMAVGKKLQLNDSQLETVFSALALLGVTVERGNSDILRRATLGAGPSTG